MSSFLFTFEQLIQISMASTIAGARFGEELTKEKLRKNVKAFQDSCSFENPDIPDFIIQSFLLECISSEDIFRGHDQFDIPLPYKELLSSKEVAPGIFEINPDLNILQEWSNRMKGEGC